MSEGQKDHRETSKKRPIYIYNQIRKRLRKLQKYQSSKLTLIDTTVLIYDGNSGGTVHVRSDLGNLTCDMHLFESRAVANLGDFFKKNLFFFAQAQRVLSYHLM